MQVSIETTSGLERRLTVGVAAEKVENEVNSRLQKAARTVRLDGFRPGKVPLKVIRQRFGAGVRREVVDDLMRSSFQEAVNQERLQLAGQPSIEAKSLEAGKDLEYIATFEVFPEIELQELADLSIEKPRAKVTDADIDAMIETFRRQQATWQTVERAAKQGDQVNINYLGTRDGEPFEGGSAEDRQLILGSNQMIPGFEAGIEGMSAGQQKVLQLTFPEDYHDQALQGAAVEFEITLQEVKEQVLAPLDEELFARYGVAEGGEEKFRLEVEDNMTRELNNAVKNLVKQKVLDAMYEAHVRQDIPKTAVDQEINAMREQMFQQLASTERSADLDLETLLPAEMFQQRAERRVKLALLLGEFISEHSMQVDEDRVREAVEELASTYEDPTAVTNWYFSNSEQLESVKNMVLEDQVVDKLLENATVTEIDCTYQEAMNQARENQ